MDKLAVDRFIRKFGIAVAQGNAAVFGGAGLSRESGFVNWKEISDLILIRKLISFRSRNIIKMKWVVIAMD